MTRARGYSFWWVVLSDLVLINAAFFLAYWMRYELEWLLPVTFPAPLSAYVPLALLLTLLEMLAFRMDRVYERHPGQSWLDQIYAIVNATAKAIVVLMAITFVVGYFRPLDYSRLLFLEAGLFSVILRGVSRWIEGLVEHRLRARGIGTRQVLIVGAGEVGRTVMRHIVARPELGYRPAGFVDDDPSKGLKDIGPFKALGSLDNLAPALEQEAVDEVIITLPWMYHRKILGIVHECERHRVRTRIVPDLFQMSLSRVDVENLGGIPLIGVKEVSIGRIALIVKRAVDILGAVAGLVLGAPLWGLMVLAIKLDSPGPVVFKQTRVGIRGRRFEMHKFRSMRPGAEEEQEALADLNEADGPIFKIRDDPRLTRVGRLLRRLSLDELPQLVNVLRGEMSLVGPRPPVPAEVAQYQPWHRKRLEVAPGMTGLWQVSGRSDLTFDEMVLLDIYYIENWSLWLDFTILLRTIPRVLLGDGAY